MSSFARRTHGVASANPVTRIVNRQGQVSDTCAADTLSTAAGVSRVAAVVVPIPITRDAFMGDSTGRELVKLVRSYRRELRSSEPMSPPLPPITAPRPAGIYADLLTPRRWRPPQCGTAPAIRTALFSYRRHSIG
jgi:hypothetical protein